MRDRFGLGWRPELAAGILANLDRIDLVEVIAEDWLEAPPRRLRALRRLATEVEVTLHGVSLGLASAVAVSRRRLERLGRLVDAVRPARWSEHLAFVRGGGLEIGHLAAPPWCAATIAGAVRNLEQAARVVGSWPEVENVATLLEPPGSDRDEAAFVAEVLAGTRSPLLLDLHNLHANCVNFGQRPLDLLERLPMGRVATVHIAGGSWIGRTERRLLDDHKHPVPGAVYELLAEVGACAPQPLAVVLERDGDYPTMAALLAELDRARAALAEGRARWQAPHRRETAGAPA